MMKALLIACFSSLFAATGGDFNLTIIHTNDHHARIEQTDIDSANCTEPDVISGNCYGGVARRHTAIKQIRSNNRNVLLLDAGDIFTGTSWFTHYGGWEESHFMNLLGYDAMALGNHEFDNGPVGLLPFLQNASFPVLACNANFSSYPDLEQYIQPYVTFNLPDGVVGVIGYITENVALMADPGASKDVIFTDVIECVTAAVSELEDQGINKIIALGHTGYSYSQQVAAIPGVDIVVDGHSHILLYNGDPPSNEEISGPYPTEVAQSDGGLALVYNAYAYGKYLGTAQVSFDEEGKVKSWPGNPILLNDTWQQDPEILQEVEQWREPILGHRQTKIGESYVLLQGGSPSCRIGECNLGNLFTDAIWQRYMGQPSGSSWSSVRIVLWNGGGIAASIKRGPILIENIMEVHPFRNAVEQIWITGSTLRKVLEHSVTGFDPTNPSGRFLQVSGLKVQYDLSRPEGSRVVEVQVACVRCKLPTYQPLDDKKIYSVLTSGYLVGGGDGYDVLRDGILKRRVIGREPNEAIEYYIRKMSPVFTGMEDRITVKRAETTRDDDEMK